MVKVSVADMDSMEMLNSSLPNDSEEEEEDNTQLR